MLFNTGRAIHPPTGRVIRPWTIIKRFRVRVQREEKRKSYLCEALPGGGGGGGGGRRPYVYVRRRTYVRAVYGRTDVRVQREEKRKSYLCEALPDRRVRVASNTLER